MSWASKHPLEVIAEWGAPILLAVAACWAASALGLPLAGSAAVGIIALAIAVVAIRLAGGAAEATEVSFEPVPFEDAVGELGELLLDDPLIEIPLDARVVRLFSKTDPTPGELVLRIEDYLSDGRRASATEVAAVEQRPVDASVALHAALANIRASLR
jgi:hypothetical protein